MRKPTNNPITLPFGATSSPYSSDRPHRGTDFSYTPDDKIYAPFDGIVQQVPNNGNDGNGTYMQQGDVRIGLLHASKYLVPNGSFVSAGQAIAVMGETGYAFGKHLHWAATRNSVFINPMTLVTNQGGDDMSQAQVDDIYKNLDAINKRLDRDEDIFNIVDALNKNVEKLYKLLDETNKRVDKLEGH